MNAVTLLAHISAHGPAISMSEACRDRVCECDDDGMECFNKVVCWGCTPVSGPWDHPYDGIALARCIVEPPCSVLQAVAGYYQITQATSPYDDPAAARG